MSVANLDVALDFWRRVPRDRAALAHDARSALSRAPSRLPRYSDRRRVPRPPRAASCSSCSTTSSTVRPRTPRRPRIRATSTSASRSTTPTPSGCAPSQRARGRSSRKARSRSTGGPNEGAQGFVSQDPRRDLARAVPAAETMMAAGARDVERRYERLHPAEMRALVDEAPIAFVPIGTLEFHGEHLPVRRRLVRVARPLPPRRGALGRSRPAARLPGLRLPRHAVHAHLRAGARPRVGSSDHRPACRAGIPRRHRPHRARPARSQPPAQARLRRGRGRAPRASLAYGLCWLELNAARFTEPQTGEPTTVDHAALRRDLVDARAPPRARAHRPPLRRSGSRPPRASTGRTRGSPPRPSSASAQIEAAAELLAERARDARSRASGRPARGPAGLRRVRLARAPASRADAPARHPRCS